jgi:hypothetical protein
MFTYHAATAKQAVKIAHPDESFVMIASVDVGDRYRDQKLRSCSPLF